MPFSLIQYPQQILFNWFLTGETTMETHIDPLLQNPIEPPTTKPIFYEGASSWRASFSWNSCNY